jgi:voltage-gated potassium channel
LWRYGDVRYRLLTWLRRRGPLADVALIAVALWLISGVAFAIVEDRPVLEGLYWSIVTISTVGYGDITPTTPAGRAIATLTIAAGIAVYAGIVSVAAGAIVESAERRRQGYIRYRGSKHIVVVGWTPAAEAAIRELFDRGYTGDVVVVTSRPPAELRGGLESRIILVRGDPERRETLLRANVPRASMVVVSTNDDAHTVLAVLSVRALNPTARIVAEALHPENVELIHKAGADIVVPTRDLGGRILAASMLELGAAMFVEDISRGDEGMLSIHEVPAARYAGRRYVDVMLELRRKGLTAVAVRRGNRLIPNPSDDLVLRPEDQLVVVVPRAPQDLEVSREANMAETAAQEEAAGRGSGESSAAASRTQRT